MTLLAALALVGSACSTAPRSASAVSVSNEEDLRREVDTRGPIIDAEIERLGQSHPWAGAYYAGDGFTSICIRLAPESGCLATWRGCLGLYVVNFGTVAEREGKLRVTFELANPEREYQRFEPDYTIEGVGLDRCIKSIRWDGLEESFCIQPRSQFKALVTPDEAPR